MKNTILAEASKDNTDFVEVMHRGVIKKAKIEYGDFRDISVQDNITEIKDSISLLDMEVSNLKRGDNIVLDSDTYYVEYFSQVVSGVYKVYATKKLITGGTPWA